MLLKVSIHSYFHVNLCLCIYLVCDVLLLCWGMTFGVNESRVSNQVPSVLHYEAPKIKMNKTGSQDQLNEFINLVGTSSEHCHY